MPGNPNWPAVIPVPEATHEYLSPDTTKTKRIDFTDFFMRFQCAEDADPLYSRIFTAHQHMAKILIEHPAMKPNLEQTFSTPANSKNKVYFMWDFVLRTFQHLAAKVSPQNPYRSPMFSDVVGRAAMAKELMLDTTGRLEAMNADVGYSDDAGIEFSEEILEAAKRLPGSDGCAGCGKKEREDGKPLLICAKCKDEKYCSVECQKKCWNVHKKVCKA